MIETVTESWELEEGAPIAPGRTVLKPLGGGTRYEVFLVWDDKLFSLAVAKVLRPSYAGEERALRELAEEAEALEALAHPVVVRGFDAVLDGEHPHLLIEHLEGPTLRRLIRREGALPLEQLLPLAAHVAAALHYLAAEGWAHLDVKPDNIVMGVPPRLIDLSIARRLDRPEISGPIGTDAYMAPEQCEPGTVGSATDVWGLGATLHHAVSGTKPFPAEEGDRFPQLTERPVVLGDDVPTGLRALIEAMLAFEPADRPTAAETVEALEPLVDELPRTLAFAKRGTRRRRA